MLNGSWLYVATTCSHSIYAEWVMIVPWLWQCSWMGHDCTHSAHMEWLYVVTTLPLHAATTYMLNGSWLNGSWLYVATICSHYIHSWPIQMYAATKMCDVTHSHVWRVDVGCSSRGSKCHVCHLLINMTHSHMYSDSFTCVLWLIHRCAVTHSYVWHVDGECSSRGHDSLVCCAMTHSHVCRDSFISVTCWCRELESWQHICDVTWQHIPYIPPTCRHDSFTCVPWLIHTCAVTHSHVWRVVAANAIYATYK